VCLQRQCPHLAKQNAFGRLAREVVEPAETAAHRLGGSKLASESKGEGAVVKTPPLAVGTCEVGKVLALEHLRQAGIA
jgi:hypothetical protein